MHTREQQEQIKAGEEESEREVFLRVVFFVVVRVSDVNGVDSAVFGMVDKKQLFVGDVKIISVRGKSAFRKMRGKFKRGSYFTIKILDKIG